MGMFDTMLCEAPLPDGWQPLGEAARFQTKDLDCLLDTYRITADGHLELAHRDEVAWWERFGAARDEPAGDRSRPCADTPPRPARRLPLTGTVEMYTSNVASTFNGLATTSDDGEPFFRTYTATFVHGTLTAITGGIDLTASGRFTRVDQATLDTAIAEARAERETADIAGAPAAIDAATPWLARLEQCTSSEAAESLRRDFRAAHPTWSGSRVDRLPAIMASAIDAIARIYGEVDRLEALAVAASHTGLPPSP